MEIYERPGWGHPSPLINLSQPAIKEVADDILEEQPIEENFEEQV